MKQTVAVFDFDGTITKIDTFPDFILFSCGWKRLLHGGLKSLLVLFLYFSRILSADAAKEKIFSNFFGGMPESEFNRISANYASERLLKITRKEALQKIQWHREQGHKLAIASASMENWIGPWARQAGFEKVIATAPEVKGGFLTGNFQTKNCNREEKVKRFLAEYPNKNNYKLYVYGDSRKDKWLFDIADEKFYQSF